ncbi:phage major capsid protein, HK97 family [Leclercia adecarboxylata]|uniref:Phage major capsid protein, HK97 family n=1 Tax=Leclercia adecarboxylata TaxID=83655 RepID=A0A4U9HRE4_9ENTR|nr:phage major capsid protein, HK97 family [Leclercia adecarboxylata]
MSPPAWLNRSACRVSTPHRNSAFSSANLIAPGRTSAPAIFWVQQTGFTNAAKVVPEGTAKAVQRYPVRHADHSGHHPSRTMFKASKQILDDFAQLQSTIDAEMRYGLKYVEEQEILFGDGTGAHLKGIVPQASAYDAAFTVEQQNGIDDLRLAMLQAQLARASRLPATSCTSSTGRRLNSPRTRWAAISWRTRRP